MKNFFKNFEEILSGFFIILMVTLVISNVILRYAFNYAIFWSEEVATISFVWAVFIGSSAVYKHKMDVGIDVLILRMSPSNQRIARFCVHFLMLLINAYILYLSLVFTIVAYNKPTAVLGVSSAVVNSALIVGFGLITIHTIRFIIEDFKGKEA